MKFLYMGIFFRFIFCVSDASIAAESSIIPFQLSLSSKPMLHLGGLQDENGINLMSGIQIHPTNNLLLGGILSPRNYENDLSLYLVTSRVVITSFTTDESSGLRPLVWVLLVLPAGSKLEIVKILY